MQNKTVCNQNSMALAQKQKYRSAEQDRKPETKSLKSPLEKVNCIADFILLVLCCEEFSFELKEFCVFKHTDSVASRGADLIGGKVWATPASPSS